MEGYNQQYLKWKAGNQSGYDWVDCLNFILIANAEVSDGILAVSYTHLTLPTKA